MLCSVRHYGFPIAATEGSGEAVDREDTVQSAVGGWFLSLTRSRAELVASCAHPDISLNYMTKKLLMSDGQSGFRQAIWRLISA